ncbi:MAG: NUDIX hydrolase [Candidatus Shapirobacteria bacterium]|jgi:ADP-ribose pyrophosphatase YjhB (NUDIX family)
MSKGQTRPKVVYQGNIIRVEETEKPDGRVFEKAVRSPGTRIIIHNKQTDKILLSREYREEIKDYDFRLPGGKVRDKIADWDDIRDRGDLPELIAEASKKEAREEVGVDVQDIRLFTVSTSGGPTVEWTLYYFVTNTFELTGKQDLEPGEEISTVWVSSQEAVDICLSGKMREGRSVAALLQYFHSENRI